MIKLKILILASFMVSGCAPAIETAVLMGIDGYSSTKEKRLIRLKLENGDTVILRKYHIEGDTIFGITEDYSEVKILKNQIYKNENIQNVKLSKTERIDNFKRHGILSAYIISGLVIGAGVGYIIPLDGSSSSSAPGTEQFLNLTGGMLIGGLAGFLLYIIIYNND